MTPSARVWTGRHAFRQRGTACRRRWRPYARTETALGAFYRRLSARVGKAKAVTATARKIAVLFVTAQVVPQKAACGRARDRKANFSSANSPTDRVSEGVPGHHRGVPGQLLLFYN